MSNGERFVEVYAVNDGRLEIRVVNPMLRRILEHVEQLGNATPDYLKRVLSGGPRARPLQKHEYCYLHDVAQVLHHLVVIHEKGHKICERLNIKVD